jgi:hypothetical protein
MLDGDLNSVKKETEMQWYLNFSRAETGFPVFLW